MVKLKHSFLQALQGTGIASAHPFGMHLRTHQMVAVDDHPLCSTRSIARHGLVHNLFIKFDLSFYLT